MKDVEETKAELLEVIVQSPEASLQLALGMLRRGRPVPERIDGVLRGLKGAPCPPRVWEMDRDRYLTYAEARILYGKGWSAKDAAAVREVMKPQEAKLGELLERGRAMEPGSWVREGRSHLVDEADRETEDRLLGVMGAEDPEAGLMTVRDCLRKGWEVNGGLVAALMANREEYHGWALVEALVLYGRRLPEGVAERLAKCEGNGELKRVLGPVLSGGKG